MELFDILGYFYFESLTFNNEETIETYKAKYAQLIVNYNEDASLSDTLYCYSIFNMLNYINKNIETLIANVQKEKQYYNKLIAGRSVTDYLPFIQEMQDGQFN